MSVNAIGPLDLLQLAVTGLKPGENYTLSLVTSRTEPFGDKEALVTFKANLAGAQVAQAIGPLRQILSGPAGAETSTQVRERFLLLTRADDGAVELVQQE